MDVPLRGYETCQDQFKRFFHAYAHQHYRLRLETRVRPFRSPSFDSYPAPKKIQKKFSSFSTSTPTKMRSQKVRNVEKRVHDHPPSRASAHRKFWRCFRSVDSGKSGHQRWRHRIGENSDLVSIGNPSSFPSSDLKLQRASLKA